MLPLRKTQSRRHLREELVTASLYLCSLMGISRVDAPSMKSLINHYASYYLWASSFIPEVYLVPVYFENCDTTKVKLVTNARPHKKKRKSSAEYLPPNALPRVLHPTKWLTESGGRDTDEEIRVVWMYGRMMMTHYMQHYIYLWIPMICRHVDCCVV